MANRVIRDWTTSDPVDLLSPEAEVFFTRLIMKADDYGSFHANAKLIKGALFPLKDYSPVQIKGWIYECVKAKLIIQYTVKEKDYIRIENFGQRLRNMRNTFPQPDDNSPQIAATVSDRPPETKRNETESETEREGTPALGLKKSFDWWWVQLDEIWLDNLKATHNGKDIQGAAREAHLSLMSNELRLRNTDLSGFKGYVNSWLSNKQKDGNRTGIKGSTSKARTGFSGTGYSEKL